MLGPRRLPARQLPRISSGISTSIVLHSSTEISILNTCLSSLPVMLSTGADSAGAASRLHRPFALRAPRIRRSPIGYS